MFHVALNNPFKVKITLNSSHELWRYSFYAWRAKNIAKTRRYHRKFQILFVDVKTLAIFHTFEYAIGSDVKIFITENIFYQNILLKFYFEIATQRDVTVIVTEL